MSMTLSYVGKNLKAFWELTRLDHGLMLGIAILVGAVISNKDFFHQPAKLLFAFLTALFLQMSTFSLNDYLDLEIDKRNRRVDRPLVRGDLKPKDALIISMVLFPLGMAFSIFVNPICFIIALVSGLLGVAYDFKMKKIKYVGNLYIAYTTAIPFIFGSLSVSSLHYAVIVLAMIAFIASLGREMMKDIMDIDGDRAEGVKSIPMYLGERKTCLIISLLYMLAVLLSFLPFLFFKDTMFYLNHLYLCLILLTDGIFIYLSIRHIMKTEHPFERYRMISLAGMLMGLFAFLLGGILKL